MDLRIASLPPEEVVTHSHDDAHFVLALDEGYRSLAHDPLTSLDQSFDAGALVWNPPGVEHRDCFDSAGRRFLAVSFAAPVGAPRDAPRRLRGVVETAARHLVGAVARFRPGDALKVEGLALALAGRVQDAVTLEEDPAPDWVLLARQAIGDLALRQGLEVATIAEAVGVHPVSLARRYRRHFGISPMEAIRRARGDKAAALIVRNSNLADVAARSGYADQSHMTREFVTSFGLTPGQYRAILD